MYYKPRIDHEVIEQYNEGLIVLSGCAGGEVGERVTMNDYEEQNRLLFGINPYLAIAIIQMQDHGHPDSPCHWDVQEKINNFLTELSKEIDVPLVVSNDGHYLSLADQGIARNFIVRWHWRFLK